MAFGHLYYCTCWSAGQLRNCQSPVRVRVGRTAWKDSLPGFGFSLFTARLHCTCSSCCPAWCLLARLLASFKSRADANAIRRPVTTAGIDSRTRTYDHDDDQVPTGTRHAMTSANLDADTVVVVWSRRSIMGTGRDLSPEFLTDLLRQFFNGSLLS